MKRFFSGSGSNGSGVANNHASAGGASPLGAAPKSKRGSLSKEILSWNATNNSTPASPLASSPATASAHDASSSQPPHSDSSALSPLASTALSEANSFNSHGPLPQNYNYQDPITAFTDSLNELFVSLEAHTRLPFNQEPTNSASHPLMLTSHAFYKLHPLHYEYSAKRPIAPPQSISAQDAIQWFRDYNASRLKPNNKPSSENQPTKPVSPSQKVVNDLFDAQVIQPKWRISLAFVESVHELENEEGAWIVTCFSDEAKHKAAASVFPSSKRQRQSIRSSPATPTDTSSPHSPIASKKDPLVRVLRKYKLHDVQKTTLWVETFKGLLQEYWQTKWEKCLIAPTVGSSLPTKKSQLLGSRSPSTEDGAPFEENNVDRKDMDFYQHHAWVHKINRKGNEQLRCLLFSRKYMFLVNALPGDTLEVPPTVRWRLDIGSCLTALQIYDEDPTVLGIILDKATAKKISKKAHSSYDFRCANEQMRNVHLMEICRLYFVNSGKTLEVKHLKEGKPSGSR